MNKTYDIAIVGAGPAGALFARELSRMRSDLSIVLINGQTEEHKKPCGGLLAPDAQRVLAQFDLTLPKDILADPQFFAVETIDLATRCRRYYQRHYLNMDRYRFDCWLLSLVPDTVAVIAARVHDIQKEKDFILKLNGGEVRARFVVGADGGGSIVRRKLYGRMPKQYLAIQEWYENKGDRVPFYSCLFDPETSDSCSWTIHKDGCVVFGGAFEKIGCREAFARQKSRFETVSSITLGEPFKKEACLVTSPRHFSDLLCGGEGFFFIGEAAGMISASSYEGISSAFISARALAESFQHDDQPALVLKRYKKKTMPLRMKLGTKMVKRAILCSPFWRGVIMRSGILAVKKKSSDG